MTGRRAVAAAMARYSERHRRRRARNFALLAVLLGLVALFYVMSIVRMGGG